MSYIALYQGTASEAAEKVRNADSSWAEAHSEWQEERTCTAHLKVRPFKTHGKCLFSAASEAVPFQRRPNLCNKLAGRHTSCSLLPDHQHFPDVVPPKEKLDGRIFAEEVFDVPVIENALQAEGARRLQFECVLRGNVEAVKRSVGPGVFGMEEGEQDAAGFHGHLDALDQRLHQRFGQEIGQVPEHHRVELLALKVQVLVEVTVHVDRGAAIAVGDHKRFVGRAAQHIFLMKLVPKPGHKSDVGGRGGPQVEDFQSFFARDGADELIEAGGAAADLLARDELVPRSLPAGAAEHFTEDARSHCAPL